MKDYLLTNFNFLHLVYIGTTQLKNLMYRRTYSLPKNKLIKDRKLTGTTIILESTCMCMDYGHIDSFILI